MVNRREKKQIICQLPVKGFYVHLIWFETPAESSDCLKTKTRIWQQQVFFQTSPSPACSLIVGWLVLPNLTWKRSKHQQTTTSPQSLSFSLSGFVVLHKLIERSLALDLENNKELIQTKKRVSGLTIWEVNCFPSVKLLMIASNVFHLSWMLTLWRKRVRLYEK